ncbi:MAG TPA: hypothetical protein DCZ68_05675 [Faecalibacterium sp.]|nr:hypothetical protein [Faecalibacterium sp.]
MGYLLWVLYGTEGFLRAGGCSRSGNKKRAARCRNAANAAISAHAKPRLFYSGGFSVSRRGQKGERSTFCCPIYRIGGATSTMIRVHCPAFTSQFS